jgi:hypothetical protein
MTLKRSEPSAIPPINVIDDETALKQDITGQPLLVVVVSTTGISCCFSTVLVVVPTCTMVFFVQGRYNSRFIHHNDILMMNVLLVNT